MQECSEERYDEMLVILPPALGAFADASRTYRG
jgi:hypothetical protein